MQRLAGKAHKLRMEHIVTVWHQHIVACGNVQAGIAGGRQTAVGLMDDADARDAEDADEADEESDEEEEDEEDIDAGDDPWDDGGS